MKFEKFQIIWKIFNDSESDAFIKYEILISLSSGGHI